MGFMDKTYCEALGIDTLPREDFVLPVVAGKNVGKWIYQITKEYRSHGRYPQTSGWCDTEAEGWARIEASHEGTRQFWREKVAWLLAGDRVDARLPQLSSEQEAAVFHGIEKPKPKKIPDGQRNVLRHDHCHYTVRTFGVGGGSRSAKGFGGRVFRWRFLDDPESKVYESDDVFWQGEIPEEFWEDLPDNVEFVDGKYAVPGFMPA